MSFIKHPIIVTIPPLPIDFHGMEWFMLCYDQLLTRIQTMYLPSPSSTPLLHQFHPNWLIFTDKWGGSCYDQSMNCYGKRLLCLSLHQNEIINVVEFMFSFRILVGWLKNCGSFIKRLKKVNLNFLPVCLNHFTLSVTIILWTYLLVLGSYS